MVRKYLDLKEKFIELGKEDRMASRSHMQIRYENWVNGVKWDWGISRQRYFGIPFPVWYCKKCGEVKFAALEEPSRWTRWSTSRRGTCDKCGSSEFVPETDIMDTWATSSLTPLINAKWWQTRTTGSGRYTR